MKLNNSLKYLFLKNNYINKKYNFIYIFYKFFQKHIQFYSWYYKYKCSPPSPHFVKQAVLLRHGIQNSSWVETGTYVGSTTALLAEKFLIVHTIEPSNKCINIARENLRRYKNVIFYHGTSEQCLEKICSSLSGDVSFWLDGHFSAGITFQGSKNTPIIFELETISKYIKSYNHVLIMIDDIRSSHTDKKDYPPLDFYVDWAKKNNLLWTIEHDIFIIKSNELSMYP